MTGTTRPLNSSKIFPSVPPPMRNPGREVNRLAGRHGDFLISNNGTECACSHASLFVLLEMHMKRRPAGVWRQRAFDNQDQLTIGLAHAVHPQDLSSVSVLQLQDVIHRFPQNWIML